MGAVPSDAELHALAVRLGDALHARHHRLATAESCTGGWVAKVLTDIPGSSGWFERGFVTYSNEAKEDMLGVPVEIIERHGAVSEETVRAMAEGALANSRADHAVAISGIAGPGGAVPGKPVGTVCFAWAGGGRPTAVRTEHFDGGREAVRRQAVAAAMAGVLSRLAGASPT